MVSASTVRAHHWHLGSVVTIGFGSYGVSRLRIGGIFAQPGTLSDYLVSTATFTADTGRRVGTVDLVKAAASAIIAVIGAVLGIALGLGLGTALAYAVTRAQQPTVTVPAGQVAAFAVVAVLAGIVASVAPARRAAKLNMLDAIASE